MSKKINIKIGARYGRLTVIRFSHVSPNRFDYFLCRCKCGNEVNIQRRKLRSGRTKSCGCLRREIAKKRGEANKVHGQQGTQEYHCWKTMIQRCTNPKHISFKYYGQRGIKVCRRWWSFPAFFTDMGKKPTRNHSIERLNNNGNYTPKNCIWATRSQQALNRRPKFRTAIDAVREQEKLNPNP